MQMGEELKYAKVMVSYYNLPCQMYVEDILSSILNDRSTPAAETLSKKIISRVVPLEKNEDIKELRKMRRKREGVVQVYNTIEPPVPCKDKECRVCLEESPKIQGTKIFVGYPSSNPALGRYFSGYKDYEIYPEGERLGVVVAEEPSSKHAGKFSLRVFIPKEIEGKKASELIGDLIWDLNEYIMTR